MFCCFSGRIPTTACRLDTADDAGTTDNGGGQAVEKSSRNGTTGINTSRPHIHQGSQAIAPHDQTRSSQAMTASVNSASDAKTVHVETSSGNSWTAKDGQRGMWQALIASIRLTTVSARQLKPPVANGAGPGPRPSAISPAAPPTLLDECVRWLDAGAEPGALLLFEGTTKRMVRQQKLDSQLMVDVNLQALELSPPPPAPAGPPRHGGSTGIEYLDNTDGSFGGGSPQQALYELQSTYSKYEALRISVHSCSASLLQLVGCPAAPQFESLLPALLSIEPQLRATLHDLLLCMLEGVETPEPQLLVHHPLAGTAGRVVLPLTLQPVVLRRRPEAAAAAGAGAGGTLVAAVLLRYDLSVGLRGAMLALHRVYAMLSSLSGIVTLFTLRGRVLHQNTASIRYMGVRMGQPCVAACSRDSRQPGHEVDDHGLSTGSVLGQLFSLASEQLGEMLDEVAAGGTWKGIVRVPPLLAPTVDPGPAQTKSNLDRSIGSSSFVPAGALNTWDRLGAGLLTTQGGPSRRPTAHNLPSDLEQATLSNTTSGLAAALGMSSFVGRQRGCDGDSKPIGMAVLTHLANGNSGRSAPERADSAGTTESVAPLSTADALLLMRASHGDAIGLRRGAMTAAATAAAAARYERELASQDANVATCCPPAESGAGGDGMDSGASSGIMLRVGSSVESQANSLLAGRPLGGAAGGRSAPIEVPAAHKAGRAALLYPFPHRSGSYSQQTVSAAAPDRPRTFSKAQSQPQSHSQQPACLNGSPSATSESAVAGAPGDAGCNFARSSPMLPPELGGAHGAAHGSLLSTLMENGSSALLSELDGLSSVVGRGDTCESEPPGAGGQGPGVPPGLSPAARRSIVRRRSALKLTQASQCGDPLSTSTWGLIDGTRIRAESKSFSVRRATSSAHHGQSFFSRVHSDLAGKQAAAAAATSSEPQSRASHPLLGPGGYTGQCVSPLSGAPSAGTGGTAGAGNSTKRRAPSRLMSFLANKNIAGAGLASSPFSTMTTRISSTSVNAPTQSLAAPPPSGASTPPAAPVTDSALPPAAEPLGGAAPHGPNPGCARPPTAGVLTPEGAAMPANAATMSMARRLPMRRGARPLMADVTEESGAEVSGAPVSGRNALTEARLSSVVAAGASAASDCTPCNSNAQQPDLLSVIAAGGSSRGGGISRANVGSCNNVMAGANGGGIASAATDGEIDSDMDEPCWHEVTASSLRDPINGETTLLLMQVDVSARVRAERRIAAVLEAEHKLLENIFPRHVLEMAAAHSANRDGDGVGGGRRRGTSKFSLADLPLASDCTSVATYHPMVTILFSDIIGFTSMCHEIPATRVMQFLNDLYSRLDTLLDVYGVYKVETIGDCYMVAGGLMTRDKDGFMTVRPSDSVDELHAAKVLAFAKAMQRETASILLPTTGQPVQMRIGLHSGPVMSGIVGSKMPRFCLFGDTVNTASRMESTCTPGCIHASAATQELLPAEDWEPTNGVQVKGKGFMMTAVLRPDDEESTAATIAGSPAGQASPSGRGGGRTRVRRASSIAYMQPGMGGMARMHQGLPQAVGPPAAGEAPIGSRPMRCHSSYMPPQLDKGYASGSIMPAAEGSGVLSGSGKLSGNIAGLRDGTGGVVGPGRRRKPHKCRSTTALEYRGLAANLPVRMPRPINE